jgi:sugar phosphate isomerase/epimerase
VLEQIFSDFKYARIDAFELMDTVLLYDDAVDRIGALSLKYSIPILGTSFEADMWDRSKHPIIMQKAETVITRVAQLGGRTLGTSVGRAPDVKTPEQVDFLHIRDQNADGTWSEAVGEGNMDYVRIAKALHAIPFTGDAVIELAHEKGFRLTRLFATTGKSAAILSTTPWVTEPESR